MITYDSWCPSSKRGLRFAPADEDEMQIRTNTANENEMEVKEILIDSKIEEIWNSEIDRRLDALEDGSTKTIPYNQVF